MKTSKQNTLASEHQRMPLRTAVGDAGSRVASVDSIYPHRLPSQVRLLEQVHRAIAAVEAGDNGRGILFIGPSGTGKTSALDMVCSLFPPYVDGVQHCRPVCRIAAASLGDMESVGKAILQQLGKPLAAVSRLKRKAVEPDVQAALIAARVRVLILEELNNALLAAEKQLRGQLADFLKNLWNRHPADTPYSWTLPRGDGLVVIVSGTQELGPAFDRKSEQSSRFSCRVDSVPLTLHRESLKHFRAVVTTMAGRFGLQDNFSEMGALLLTRLMLACESHLRRLQTLITETAVLQKECGAEVPILELLANAFDDVLRADVSHPNPFRWSDAELMLRVEAIAK